MSKLTMTVLGVVVMLLAAVSISTADTAGTRYILVFKGDKIPDNAAELVLRAGGVMAKTFPQIGVAVAVSDAEEFASAVSRFTDVESVGREQARELPGARTAQHPAPGPTSDDSLFDLQWNIRRVHADKAWAITTGSHNTVVAVIDTGIAWNHPDLAPNVVYAACFSTAGSCAGMTDLAGCPCSPYPDFDPHGTNVAGVVAAAFGGGGLVGVAPDIGMASYNIFEFDPSGGYTFFDSSAWAAMFDAAEMGFRVINFSSGLVVIRPEDIATIRAWERVVRRVLQQGVTIVASAGNDALNLNGPLEHIPSDLPGVISVGMTGIRPEPLFPQPGAFDVLTAIPFLFCDGDAQNPLNCVTQILGSNFGAVIDLVAPGGDCGPDGKVVIFPNDPAQNFAVCDTRYNVLTTDIDPANLNPSCAARANCPLGKFPYFPVIGTSFAAPHVAGVAGLLLDKDPALTPHQVTEIIKATAEKIGKQQSFGSGMLDAFGALSR